MKNLFLSLIASISLTGSFCFANDGKGLPLVFDPQTKKYFIGGTSKFVLKQGEQSAFVDRIEISIDGGDYKPYGEAINFDHEGKHTLKFRAVSAVNNWAPVQFVEVFVDLTPPTTEAKFIEDKFYIDDKKQVYVALNSSISLVAQDNLSGVATTEYSLDGKNFTPTTQPIKFTKSGHQTVYYHSIDRVNNQEPVKMLDLIVDSVPPTSQLNLQGQAKPTTLNKKTFISDSVAFEITAADDSSAVKQIWVSVDGKSPSPYIKPLYFLQEGPHSIKYYALDHVGNKEDEKTFDFYTVSQPPRSTVKPIGKLVNTGGINYVRGDFKLALEAQDNVVGLDRLEYRLDQESTPRPYIEPIHFVTPGPHTVTYHAIDRAGNVEPSKTFTLYITESTPETTVATAQPLVVREGTAYSPAPNVLTFNVGNNQVGIQETLVSVDDAPFAPYHGPITLAADRKIHKVQYKSVDKLGNEETPKILTLNMVNTVPIVDLFISNGQSSEEKVHVDYLEGSEAKPEADGGGSSRQPAKTNAPAKPAAKKRH